MQKRPVISFILWAALVVLAFVLPRFFPPPDGVDIAPAAGLAFLILAGSSFLLAVYLLAHTILRGGDYTRAERALTMAPFTLTVAALVLGVVWFFGASD